MDQKIDKYPYNKDSFRLVGFKFENNNYYVLDIDKKWYLVR
jgi:hypothetical protein